MARYKWDSAREWLDQKVQEAAAKNDVAELVSIYNAIIGFVDNDSIQDVFQTEMAADGFFKPLRL